MPREKSSYRTRSPSYSSDSSYEKKRSKSKHKRRSRDRSLSSQRRKRSSSRSRKRRSYSRSKSPDRYESRSRRRSLSRSKRSNHLSVPRDRSRSRSRSRSKYSKKSRSYRRSRSSSRSSSLELEKPIPKKVNLDDTEAKIEKAIKAAAAAGLSMTKIPTYEYKEVDVKEDMPTIHDRNLLAELNNDSFVPKTFTSSKSKKQQQNIVIDLNTSNVTVPEADITAVKDDSIIDFSKIPDEEELKAMWIRKLYLYRKKMLKGDI